MITTHCATQSNGGLPFGPRHGKKTYTTPLRNLSGTLIAFQGYSRKSLAAGKAWIEVMQGEWKLEHLDSLRVCLLLFLLLFFIVVLSASELLAFEFEGTN